MSEVTLHARSAAVFDALLAVDPDTLQSVHPREYSGCMRVGDGRQLVIQSIASQGRNDAVTPRGGITFHTHNVPAGTRYGPHMSTDVPSWEDIYLVILETRSKGLRVHLIFTPGYAYAIHVDPRRDAALIDRAHRQGSAWLQAVYESTLQRHGRNYGGGFQSDWLAVLRSPEVGLSCLRVITRSEGEPVSFPESWLGDGEMTPCGPSGESGWMLAICGLILLWLLVTA